MKHNRIIFITNLTLWSMGKGHGGPAFTQTVKKYNDEGWEVYLVSDEPSNAEYPYLDSSHNIIIPLNRFSRLGGLRKIGLIFRYLDQLCAYFSFNKVLDRLLADGTSNTVLYAYELLRFFPARRCARKYHLLLVTRFQGTKLIEVKKHTFIEKLRRFPSYNATASPADLVIMTDDGTQGNRILRELGNNSPTLFLKNGLELMERDITSMKAAFDRSAFRASLGVAEGETMFLTVSRLTNWKKVERAIDGFSACMKKGAQGKLVIVGDGEEKASLMQRADALGLSQQVIFTGAVAHDAVYDYMMACDVFVSLYDLSNVGNPLLEAMTLGKCVVTLDVGDTRTIISNRENGILLTYDTLPSLGDVMAELVQSPALREFLGTAASDYARTHLQTWKARMDTEFQAVSALLEKQ